MSLRFRKLVFALLIPSLSFFRYSRSLDSDYSTTNLLWGVLATTVLAIYLYLLPVEKIERFSVAWGIGISMSIGLVFVGVVLSISMETGVLYAWARYMLFFGLMGSIPFIAAPKDHKPYKWSFFKRVKPIEEATEARQPDAT